MFSHGEQVFTQTIVCSRRMNKEWKQVVALEIMIGHNEFSEVFDRDAYTTHYTALFWTKFSTTLKAYSYRHQTAVTYDGREAFQ
jgi:hypothetical protein